MPPPGIIRLGWAGLVWPPQLLPDGGREVSGPHSHGHGAAQSVKIRGGEENRDDLFAFALFNLL